MNRQWDGSFRVFTRVDRLALLETSENDPGKIDLQVAARLNTVESTVLVLELPDDLPRPRDKEWLGYPRRPMERAATASVSIGWIPGGLHQSEGFGGQLVNDLGFTLHSEAHRSPCPGRLRQDNDQLVPHVQIRQCLSRSVGHRENADRQVIFIPALLGVGVVVEIEPQRPKIFHQWLDLERCGPLDLAGRGDVEVQVVVLDPNDMRAVPIGMDHVVPFGIVLGSLVPLGPRDQVTPPLGSQRRAALETVFVEPFRIVRVGHPVVLGRVEVGKEEIQTLQAGDPVLQELHLELQTSRAVEPPVSLAEDLGGARQHRRIGRPVFAHRPYQPVASVAEAEHRFGKWLLQRFCPIVLVEHEALCLVGRRHGRLAVADERATGDLAADRLHQQHRSLLEQQRHRVFLDDQVADSVRGGSIETGGIERLEDLLALAGEIEPSRCGGLGRRLGPGRASTGENLQRPEGRQPEGQDEDRAPGKRTGRGRHLNLRESAGEWARVGGHAPPDGRHSSIGRRGRRMPSPLTRSAVLSFSGDRRSLRPRPRSRREAAGAGRASRRARAPDGPSRSPPRRPGSRRAPRRPGGGGPALRPCGGCGCARSGRSPRDLRDPRDRRTWRVFRRVPCPGGRAPEGRG